MRDYPPNVNFIDLSQDTEIRLCFQDGGAKFLLRVIFNFCDYRKFNLIDLCQATEIRLCFQKGKKVKLDTGFLELRTGKRGVRQPTCLSFLTLAKI